MTKMQIVHFYRIAQCTMVKNVPCAWQFICKASSNTLCTLFVQTHATMKHLKGGQGNLTTLLGHTFHWIWGTITGVQAPGNNIRWSEEVNIPFGQPTLSCSVTLLPFPSKNRATSAWPSCAAIRSGVVPNCTWSEGDTREYDGTDISTSSVPHQLVYMYTHYKTGVVLTVHITKRFTQLKYKCPCLLCPCSWCVQRGHKSIRQAANNVGQPCQLPSHQIHRISRGTPPWTTGPLGLPSARLCIHHHPSQRGGPPFWGQGTQQQQDGRPQHTSERHCFLPALNNKNRLTTDQSMYTHMQENKGNRHVVYVIIRYIVCPLLRNTRTHWIEWHGISRTTKSHTMWHTIWTKVLWSATVCPAQTGGVEQFVKGSEVTLYRQCCL